MTRAFARSKKKWAPLATLKKKWVEWVTIKSEPYQRVGSGSAVNLKGLSVNLSNAAKR